MEGDGKMAEDLRFAEESAETMSVATADNLISHWKHRTDSVQVVTQIMRCFRTALALDGTGVVRRHLTENHAKFVLCQCGEILKSGPVLTEEPQLVRARCAVQLLVNACVDNQEFQGEMLSDPAITAVATDCLHHSDAKLRNYAGRLWHLVMQQANAAAEARTFSGFLLGVRNGEDPLFLSCTRTVLERQAAFVAAGYENMANSDRLTLLDVLHEMDDDGSDFTAMLTSRFKVQSKMLLTTFGSKTGENANPAETVKLLELLCKWSSSSSSLAALQEDTSVLIDSVYLLRMICDLGKSRGGGQFTPITKVADISTADVENNPVFGFKGNLVRLIGNMCWKHKKNQNTVRDCEGIHLLLNCSAIDGNNPLISQWVIFATRNLCEDNPENQKLISELDKKGVAMNSVQEELELMKSQ